MATINDLYPTFRDLGVMMGADGALLDAIEPLMKDNPWMRSMVWQEGNLQTGNQTLVRSGLPSVAFQRIYGRSQPKKSQFTKVTDTCAMMREYSQVSVEMAELSGNVNRFRSMHDMGIMQAMTHKLADTIFFGDQTVSEEEFTGLAPRYSDTSAENGSNILNGGSSDTDNASIWLICWGPETVHGIVPKGMPAGLQVEDLGRSTSEVDENGTAGLDEVYRTLFRWWCGLTVKDWRYIVRIPNIDRSALTYNAATGANLPKLMFEALAELPTDMKGICAFHMDKELMTKAQQQIAYGVQNSTMTTDMVGGYPTQMFQGRYPMVRCDALAVNESLITF